MSAMDKANFIRSIRYHQSKIFNKIFAPIKRYLIAINSTDIFFIANYIIRMWCGCRKIYNKNSLISGEWFMILDYGKCVASTFDLIAFVSSLDHDLIITYMFVLPFAAWCKKYDESLTIFNFTFIEHHRDCNSLQLIWKFHTSLRLSLFWRLQNCFKIAPGEFNLKFEIRFFFVHKIASQSCLMSEFLS